jgi:hypothetical protein
MTGAGGVSGTIVSGLTGGVGGAVSAAVAGATMMGVYQVLQHKQAKEQ